MVRNESRKSVEHARPATTAVIVSWGVRATRGLRYITTRDPSYVSDAPLPSGVSVQ